MRIWSNHAKRAGRTERGHFLLNYGKDKWGALGLKYPLEGVETPSPAAVREVVAQLESAGLNVLCDAKAPAHLSAAHTGAHS